MISFPVQEITGLWSITLRQPSLASRSANYWATIPLTESTIPLGAENWIHIPPESVAHLLLESVAHLLPESVAHFDRNTHLRIPRDGDQRSELMSITIPK